eukprot:4418023-Pyramimonas_sp.AAC.1
MDKSWVPHVASRLTEPSCWDAWTSSLSLVFLSGDRSTNSVPLYPLYAAMATRCDARGGLEGV